MIQFHRDEEAQLKQDVFFRFVEVRNHNKSIIRNSSALSNQSVRNTNGLLSRQQHYWHLIYHPFTNYSHRHTRDPLFEDHVEGRLLKVNSVTGSL